MITLTGLIFFFLKSGTPDCTNLFGESIFRLWYSIGQSLQILFCCCCITFKLKKPDDSFESSESNVTNIVIKKALPQP